MNVFTAALAATVALTAVVAPAPTMAQLAGEYNQQQTERSSRIASCYNIYNNSEFGASADRRDHDRVTITANGTIIKSSATFDGTQCDSWSIGTLGQITQMGTSQSVSQIVREGSELVNYNRLHSNNGQPTITRRVIGNTNWLVK